jgi:hypothetical protein
MRGGDIMHIKLLENLMEDLGTGRRIILKWL